MPVRSASITYPSGYGRTPPMMRQLPETVREPLLFSPSWQADIGAVSCDAHSFLAHHYNGHATQHDSREAAVAALRQDPIDDSFSLSEIVADGETVTLGTIEVSGTAVEPSFTAALAGDLALGGKAELNGFTTAEDAAAAIRKAALPILEARRQEAALRQRAEAEVDAEIGQERQAERERRIASKVKELTAQQKAARAANSASTSSTE